MHEGFARAGPAVPKRQNSAAAPGTSDEILVQRIAAGNQLAMQALFARHQVRVYRFVLRILGNAALAEDLTSEVFLTVWRQAHRFKGRSAVSTWLLAIAHNKARTELRRRRGEALDDDTLAIEDPALGPESELLLNERGKILRRCLTQLSPEHRKMIDLVYYHEKSIQEVAEIVGIPVNTVKTRTFYARRRLSELLAAEGIVGAGW
jgi:RNA polymerase sigma-70 factor (ECF subfamily)